MQNRRKILFVIESLAIGGAEKSLVNLLNSFDFSEFEVDLFLFAKDGILERKLPEFVNVKHLLYSYPLASRVEFAIRRKLRNGIQTEDLFWKSFNKNIPKIGGHYDVAVGYSQGFATYFVAEKIRADKKYTWVNTDYVKAGYNANYDVDYYKKMNGIVAASDAGKQIFDEVFDKKGLEVPVYAIEDLLDIEGIRKQSEEPCDVSSFNGLKLVSVGRLHPAKGFQLAIEAAEILKEKEINFHWWIIGEGDERAKLEKLIAEKKLQDYITLQGADTNPYKFMRAADIYVQTSVYEGFSITVREALAMGKPVVSTNFPSVFSAIKDGENGLIAVMSGNDISYKIMTLFENKELQLSFGKKSKNDYRNEEEAKLDALKKILTSYK